MIEVRPLERPACDQEQRVQIRSARPLREPAEAVVGVAGAQDQIIYREGDSLRKRTRSQRVQQGPLNPDQVQRDDAGGDVARTQEHHARHHRVARLVVWDEPTPTVARERNPPALWRDRCRREARLDLRRIDDSRGVAGRGGWDHRERQ